MHPEGPNPVSKAWMNGFCLLEIHKGHSTLSPPLAIHADTVGCKEDKWIQPDTSTHEGFGLLTLHWLCFNLTANIPTSPPCSSAETLTGIVGSAQALGFVPISHCICCLVCSCTVCSMCLRAGCLKLVQSLNRTSTVWCTSSSPLEIPQPHLPAVEDYNREVVHVPIHTDYVHGTGTFSIC